MTLTSIGAIPFTFSYESTDDPSTESDVAEDLSGERLVMSGASITIEASRLDFDQIACLARRDILTYVVTTV